MALLMTHFLRVYVNELFKPNSIWDWNRYFYKFSPKCVVVMTLLSLCRRKVWKGVVPLHTRSNCYRHMHTLEPCMSTNYPNSGTNYLNKSVCAIQPRNAAGFTRIL